MQLSMYVLPWLGPQLVSWRPEARERRSSRGHGNAVCMAKSSGRKPKSGAKPSRQQKISVNGFGGGGPVRGSRSKEVSSSGSKGQAVMEPFRLIRDPKIDALMRWLQASSASASRVGIAHFDTSGVRGVVALEPIRRGEVIVSIPEKHALQLGATAGEFAADAETNPGYAAADLVTTLLQIRRHTENPSVQKYAALLDALPGQEDCTTTDFFLDSELEQLQWQPVVDETKMRQRKVRIVYDKMKDSYEQLMETEKDDGLGGADARALLSYDFFNWAVFIVVSRVIGIHHPQEGMMRYLIPLVDMFNHDNRSVHELAFQKGNFRVIAGRDIEIGEQICIKYGGGTLSNDRLLQDYGFVESSNMNEQLISSLTKECTDNGEAALRLRTILDQFPTSLIEDTKLLASEEDLGADHRDARPHLKKALLFRTNLKQSLLHRLSQLDVT
ncbi:Histone-lysine N-methyltransferase setd3 [Porphyridium purpureum]|uniref:Histone-lysine N-methyltransferase setd3 n=1 Tax=Porphyridium purpureum TaxID=35688 RepID=A0A5J4YVL9_PORPP|nr:Histone-lysine N-methyltransferase setd3 [Porphyridium purpureum]|eukprot:POR4984..scf227_4